MRRHGLENQFVKIRVGYTKGQCSPQSLLRRRDRLILVCPTVVLRS